MKSFSHLLTAALFFQAESFLRTNVLPCNQAPYQKRGIAALHSSSTSSKQRQQSKTKRSFQRNQSTYIRRDQLRRVIDSIAFYGNASSEIEEGPTQELLEAMRMLSRARTQKHVILAGRELEKLDIVKRESRAIQERVLKASALAGLLNTSLDILWKMLQVSYLPSHIAYTALCSALRYSGRRTQLEDILYKLAQVTSERGELLNVVAWNTYLAMICSSVKHPQDKDLEQTWNWLQLEVARKKFNVEPDVASCNTVMFAAARVGNRTLVDDIWNKMAEHSIKPDIRSYNARLRVTSMAERLDLFDDIQSTEEIQPDRYTTDLVIIPLIREGRVGDVENLLDSIPDSEFNDAFSAILTTLVSKGEVSSARALFDTFVAPYLSKETKTLKSLALETRPQTRHFNILIDGYRRLAESFPRSGPNTKDYSKIQGHSENSLYRSEKEMAQYEGQKLYRLMKTAGIEQDAYTLTSMMGLCESTEELFELIQGSNIKMTPAAIRAAITACGRLGDPSAACVLLDHYSPFLTNSRVWNVFLGALSAGAKLENVVLDVRSCPMIRIIASQGGNGTLISDSIDGLRCTEAVLVILDAMRGNSKTVVAPRPDSQSYCIAASALQYGTTDTGIAMKLFQNATDEGIPTDGRFVNALFRCFGDDIGLALSSWKNYIRKSCIAHESRTNQALVSIYRPTNKNLIAAYNGLFYVCGRALRPDIALRLAYAMNREGIEPNEVSLNNYLSGKRIHQTLDEKNGRETVRRSFPQLLSKINLMKQYENLLDVECTRYDKNNKRMVRDKRVRIIV